jgi:glycoprotein-N-acetylgalactosamine 3-beta-galactosyltransferase
VNVTAQDTDSTTTNASSTKVEPLVVTSSPSTSPKQQQQLIHTNIPPPEARIGPNQEIGYVHDPQFLIKNPRPFHIQNRNYVCVPPGAGEELPEGAQALARIRKHIETSTAPRNVTLMCAIYTHSSTGAVEKTNAVQETWGRKCDGLLFAGDKSNMTTGHMHLPSRSKYGFGYKGMIQRTRAILAYLYDNFLEDYDFFHISGDDVFVLVENLKEFLASDKVREWDLVPDQYMIAGFWTHWGKSPEGYFYLGGGSGYTLSRKALKAYVEGPLQTCNPTQEGTAEDVAFSNCAKQLNPKFIDTRDSTGAHRYHQMPVQRHASFPKRKWGFSMGMIRQSINHLQRNFSFPYVEGAASISNSSVTFHKHYPPETRRIELLLYQDGDAECGAQFSYCPLPNKTVDESFPIGMPQNLTFGRFRDQTGAPFITQDFWTDLVDNRRTFFVRPHDAGFPTMEQLADWIRSRLHPITLVMNNQVDQSWPSDLNQKGYELILNETNLHAVFAGNARTLEHYPKLKPLPIGLKWQFRKTALFGEQKGGLVATYAHVSTSVEETKKLFANENRTSTVWVRPMTNSNKRTQKYVRKTPALAMVRWQICGVLNQTAPETGVCARSKISQQEYFDGLRTHRFMISPAGNGLDTHATWEALLAGCIPIVPRSPLDSLFEGLPVWLVDSWEEVTDEAALRKEQELKGKAYKWEKVFAKGWQAEINEGLCRISPDENKH